MLISPFNTLNNWGSSSKDVFRIHCPDSYIGDDKEARPIYWVKIGYISSQFHIIKKQVSEDELFIRHVRQQERMMFRLKNNSIKYNKSIEK